MLQTAGLFLALILAVVMITRKRPLYQAMLAAILLLALVMDLPPGELLRLAWSELGSKATLELVFAVGLISLLSRLLKDLGLLEKLMPAIVVFLRSTKLALIAIPAMIGLLPVVGGAIVSAPLVDDLGERLNLPNGVKTSANLIFRHAVYYVNPFTPSLILLAGITGIEILTLIKYLFPVGLISIIAGYFFLLHPAREKDPAPAGAPAAGRLWLNNLKPLFRYGAPLFLSLALFMIARMPLLVSLMAGIIAALLLGNKKGADFRDIFLRGPDFLLMLGIAEIMIFRSFVGNLAGLNELLNLVARSNIPVFLLFILVPFLIGWVSAAFSITLAITAPLLFTLVPPGHNEVFYAVLLYSSGFFSYFTSPVHICQIVSNNFFRTRALEGYRVQFPVLALTLLTGILVYLLGTVFS